MFDSVVVERGENWLRDVAIRYGSLGGLVLAEEVGRLL